MNYQVITEDDAMRMFDELLDESGAITVAGLTFYPSKILSECDPIAYNIYLGDYIDQLAVDDIYVEGLTDDERPTDEEEED
jgi:hypothetical protein